MAASLPVVVALLAATTSTPASARPVDDRCLQRAPIPASAVAAASRLGCSLVGRVVTDGRVSVMVPPPGMSVAGEGVGTHGEARGLRVTNTGSRIRVVSEARGSGGRGGGGWYLAPLSTTTGTTTATTTTTTTSTITSTTGTITPSSPAMIVTQRAGNRPACKDRTFNLEHHKWARSLAYRINLAKMPGRFRANTVLDQIQAANANMRKGRNTCGKPRLGTPVSQFLGRTTRKPNVSPAGPSCGRANRNNIVGFGNLPGGLLGWTCYWYIGNQMVGTDMLIDNGPMLATKLSSSCGNEWDFEGTVTHEWGHAFGLAHTGSGHANLTMQHLLRPCSTYARTLGLGDWLGMKKMYGVR